MEIFTGKILQFSMDIYLDVKGAATFQKFGVSVYPFCLYKRPTTATKGVEGEGRECPPPQPTRRSGGAP